MRERPYSNTGIPLSVLHDLYKDKKTQYNDPIWHDNDRLPIIEKRGPLFQIGEAVIYSNHGHYVLVTITRIVFRWFDRGLNAGHSYHGGWWYNTDHVTFSIEHNSRGGHENLFRSTGSDNDIEAFL